MLWRHIICQKGGQAVCPLRNKCGDHTAQSPYVTLRPSAYVTDNKPYGCIRSSAERGGGEEELRIEPGHVSTLDPCLGHDTSFPGTLLWVVRSSLGGVRTPSNGFGLLYLEGPGCAHRDPKPTRSDGVVSEAILRAAKGSHTGIVPSYRSKGYP
jgi:hypothetical protein